MLEALLVSPRPLPGRDPEAVRQVRLVEALGRWRGATILSPAGLGGPLQAPGVRHLVVPIPATASWDQRLVGTLAALETELARLRPRLLHVFDVHLMPPILVHTWRGVQVVVEPGLTAATRLREADRRLSSAHLLDLARREDDLLAQASAVVARSATETAQLFKRGAPAGTVWTLPDGPLPGPAAPLPSLPHLAYVGEIDDKSGWAVLLDALPHVAAPWRLTAFVGDGRPAAEAEVRARRLDAKVTFARPDADLAERLATARLLVCPVRGVPSLRTGAWTPAALHWARSLARPVVAPDLSVLEDFVGPAFIGVPPDDPQALAAALDRTLRSPAELDRRAAAAADHRRRISWDLAEGTLRALWTRLMTESTARG